MKRNNLLAACMIFAALFAVSAMAQTGVAQAPAGKIGLVNTNAFADDKAGITKFKAALGALNAETGLQMARLRGRAQLPHWSLLAICEFRERGFSRRLIASDFRCSLGTVAHALQFRNQSYEPLSGARRLTKGQQRPPRQIKGPLSR